MALDIVYQNTRGIRTKLETFSTNLVACGPDIACITESWLNPEILTSEFNQLNYQIFRRDRDYDASGTCRGGGCLIAVKPGIIAERIYEFETRFDLLEDLWIRIALPNFNLYLCLTYISNNRLSEMYRGHFEKVRQTILGFEDNARVIMVGDYNLPSLRWILSGDTLIPEISGYTLEAVDDLINTMSMCDLAQFNSITNSNNVTLDIVLSNFNTNLINIARSQCPLVPEDANHPTLEISINTDVTYIQEKSFKTYNFRKANYVGINGELAGVDWTILENLSTNAAMSVFYGILCGIIGRHVPKFSAKNKYPFWYSNELIKLLNKKERKRIKYKKYRTNDNYIKFSQLRAQAKVKIRECYDLFISNLQINIPNNIKLFWAFTKSKRQTNTYTSGFRYNGRSSGEPDEICQMFSEFFKTTYSTTNLVDVGNAHSIRPNNVRPILISNESVLDLLNGVDVNKNGGPDGIPNIFLKHTSRQISKPLTILFNKSLSEGVFPDKFKTANVTPIYKRGDKAEVTNYRPICLLNAFSKIFERLVHGIILSIVENVIDKGQHGFIKDRSTLTNLSIYSNFIANALDAGFDVHTIYTDFTKAFDMVNFDILLKKLGDCGVDGRLLLWIESYLKGRTMRVVFAGGGSDVFTPTSGVPQGSVLGPLLFTIFINDLGSRLSVRYLLFADDLKIFWIIRNGEDVRWLQVALNELVKWCGENGLDLNPSKCNSICFSNRRFPVSTNYAIGNTQLDGVTTVRDLGIFYDSKLKFGEHIDIVVNAAYRMLGFIMRTTKNFTNIKCINFIYNSLVRSRLEYLTPVWSPYQITYDSKIERVQKRYTRYTNYRGGFPYSEYEDRLISLNYLSLSARRKYYDMCLLYKIIHNNDLPELSNQLIYRNVNYPSRYNPLFRPNIMRTNYGLHMDIICRLQLTFNNSFNDIDILNLSYINFKKEVLERIRTHW